MLAACSTTSSSDIGSAKTRTAAGVTIGLLALANLVIWGIALLAFRSHWTLVGAGGTCFLFGLSHALDADHIAAIDNVTRKLMQERKRPLLVGLYFSLGHSTIVILLSVLIALTAGRIQTHFGSLAQVGGLVGTGISGFFLLAMAGVNVLVLAGVMRAFAKVKNGQAYEEQDVAAALARLGFIGRMFRPIVQAVDHSWKMYFVGFLFGLGFDTATQVGMFGISAVAAIQGTPTLAIFMFPLLFTGGMCLVDSLDGILMVGAYGWAYVNPVRKLYYNMTITAVSIVIAVAIGGVELLGLIGDQLNLQGRFWDSIGWLNDDKTFGRLGVAIISIFLVSWLISIIGYRLMGYQRLESTIEDSAIA
jgi:nickel/cobalt transporter (NiCoT) family protein